MKSSFIKLCFIALLFYIPVQTMAWGMQGHRIVGEVADSYINQKARKEIQKILGPETMAITSNWADFIKSDPAYNYLSNWHYANFPDYLDYQALKTQMDQDTSINIYNRIQFLTAHLKNKSLENSKKLMYLRLIIHLVGDLHQPMHMGRKEDSGGNGIKIFWFNQPSNLHRLWDEQLIESQQLSYTEYSKVINHPSQAQIKKWQSDDLGVWAFESYEISRQLYSVKPEEKLSYRYIFDHIATVNERLLKGGVRLAGLLNQIFA